jgi:WD40 repeat protein
VCSSHLLLSVFFTNSTYWVLAAWILRVVCRRDCIQTYRGHTKELTSIQFSPDGKWIVTGGADGVAKVCTASSIALEVHE